MRTKETYPGAQTVSRAIALLKAFSDERPALSLRDLARAVGLNKTTAYRLLSALEREGLVARNSPDGAYRLGPEVIALGARALRATGLRDAARPELEALARETGETADVEILAGSEALVIDEVHGNFVVGTAIGVGTRWPAHATSTGKVILAFLPDDEREAALPRRLATPTDRSIASREALRAELGRVRERGYATAVGELEDDFVAVGAPVFDHNRRVAGAISVGGPINRLTTARIPEVAGLVTAAAGRVSERLGFRSS